MAQDRAQHVLSSGATTGDWTLDDKASSVRIAHRTMWGLATVRGAFTEIAGHGTVGPEGEVSGVLTVSTASLDTRSAQRDKHLASSDFFDSGSHPELTVRVTGARPEGELVVLDAELTVRGRTVPLSLVAQAERPEPDAVRLTVETTVDRGAFGMAWNRMGMIKGPATVTVDALFRR